MRISLAYPSIATSVSETTQHTLSGLLCVCGYVCLFVSVRVCACACVCAIEDCGVGTKVVHLVVPPSKTQQPCCVTVCTVYVCVRVCVPVCAAKRWIPPPEWNCRRAGTEARSQGPGFQVTHTFATAVAVWSGQCPSSTTSGK